MKKKIIACLVSCSVAAVSITGISPVKAFENDYILEDDENYYEDDSETNDSENNDSDWIDGTESITDDTDSDDPVIIDIGPGDLKVTPKKKTLRVGESFKLDMVAADEAFWDEYDDDVWEASYDEAIESIEYKSKKPYYVKVNSKGEVKAKHKTKGYVKIITTVYFAEGGMQTYTTQVYVKK